MWSSSPRCSDLRADGPVLAENHPSWQDYVPQLLLSQLFLSSPPFSPSAVLWCVATARARCRLLTKVCWSPVWSGVPQVSPAPFLNPGTFTQFCRYNNTPLPPLSHQPNSCSVQRSLLFQYISLSVNFNGLSVNVDFFREACPSCLLSHHSCTLFIHLYNPSCLLRIVVIILAWLLLYFNIFKNNAPWKHQSCTYIVFIKYHHLHKTYSHAWHKISNQ